MREREKKQIKEWERETSTCYQRSRSTGGGGGGGVVYVCQQFIKSNNAVGTATVYLTPGAHIGRCITDNTLDTIQSACVLKLSPNEKERRNGNVWSFQTRWLFHSSDEHKRRKLYMRFSMQLHWMETKAFKLEKGCKITINVAIWLNNKELRKMHNKKNII